VSPERRFRRRAAALAGFMATCAAVFAFMWGFAGGDLNPLDRAYRVQAVVPTAVALATNSDVRHAGVRIGKVKEIAPRGGNAVLLLELDDDHAPVYRNARILVRTKTLLGENYVDLDPGAPTAPRIPDGGLLSLANAGEAVQLDEILSTFNRHRRRDLQRLLSGLGQGLDGRGGDLNRFLEASAAIVREGRPVNEILAADKDEVASLVNDFGRVMKALGDRGDAIRTFTQRSGELARAVAARDSELTSMLAALPGFLRQARVTTTALRGFAAEGTPVIRDLRLATRELVPGVRLLRPAATRGRRTMRALDDFQREASPALSRLPAFARGSADLTEPLEHVLRQTNPLLAHLAPYWREYGFLGNVLRTGSGTYDALGHYSHTGLYFGRSTQAGLLTPDQQRTFEELVDIGALATTDTIGANPHPKPGRAGLPEPFEGEFERVRAEPPYSD
jgi:phospholipid/cholesterol/gamma-HCH transport system substrate-binding protein